MSFYKGIVVELFHNYDNSRNNDFVTDWTVNKTFYYNTDSNKGILFKHIAGKALAYVPQNEIKNFTPTTSKISRVFNPESYTITWQAHD